jgi:hypothetical protein
MNNYADERLPVRINAFVIGEKMMVLAEIELLPETVLFNMLVGKITHSSKLCYYQHITNRIKF